RGGFVVKTGASEASKPELLIIRAAYQVRRGDAFRKYKPADFVIGKEPITIEPRGAEIIEEKDNLIRVRILEEDFHIEVTGFDENRDLRVSVNVREIENGAENT
ncbi:MAG: hypothetical protein AB1442_17760, partial [Nitrospirota bacterium]